MVSSLLQPRLFRSENGAQADAASLETPLSLALHNLRVDVVHALARSGAFASPAGASHKNVRRRAGNWKFSVGGEAKRAR